VVAWRRGREAGFVLAVIAFQIVLAHLYHGRGHFPFPWSEWIAALVFAGGGIIVSRNKVVRGTFAGFLLVAIRRTVAAARHPSPAPLHGAAAGAARRAFSSALGRRPARRAVLRVQP